MSAVLQEKGQLFHYPRLRFSVCNFDFTRGLRLQFQESIGGMSSRRSRINNEIDVSGTVSKKVGKGYVPSSTDRKRVLKSTESTAVEKVQAWEAFTDLTGPSNTRSEDVMPVERTSFVAAPSNNDPQQGGTGRSYASVVANCGTHPTSGPKTSSKQMIPKKSPKDELDNLIDEELYNESHTKKLECPSGHTAKDQYFPGDNLRWVRNIASHNLDSMNSFSDKADHLDNREMQYKDKPSQADEKASKDILNSRNNGSVNQMTIDLYGQRVREGIKILENHLEFGVYCRSLVHLRVITGYGSPGTGPSKLKHAVVDLLKKENIKWQEENKDSLLITFDGQKRELAFVECRRYSD
ncbi:hypothetical protein L1887_38760 [Cichorium endivia]|nr:hypothetical protein L1887_38760 [Cichorium endivia]